MKKMGMYLRQMPRRVAEKIDELYTDRKKAELLGKAGRRSLDEKHMDWDYVIEQLLR